MTLPRNLLLLSLLLAYALPWPFYMAISRIMCFGNGKQDDPDAKKSREIERQLREDQKRMQKEVKVLLLGE